MKNDEAMRNGNGELEELGRLASQKLRGGAGMNDIQFDMIRPLGKLREIATLFEFDNNNYKEMNTVQMYGIQWILEGIADETEELVDAYLLAEEAKEVK